MDNKKKKKLDRKRISLCQVWEVDYLRKKAKELIKMCEEDQKHSKALQMRSYVHLFENNKMSTSTVARIAKALLKSTR